MIARGRLASIGLIAALTMAGCTPSEQGVVQGRKNAAVISLSEGACKGTCPVYDLTLHPDGAYTLNGERFVKTTGVTEGQLDKGAWAAAETALTNASFWTLNPVQTPGTMTTCHTDAPTATILWRTEAGKEKTVAYNAGCGVAEMNRLVASLRAALKFDDLVWTDDRFAPDGSR